MSGKVKNGPGSLWDSNPRISSPLEPPDPMRMPQPRVNTSLEVFEDLRHRLRLTQLTQELVMRRMEESEVVEEINLNEREKTS